MTHQVSKAYRKFLPKEDPRDVEKRAKLLIKGKGYTVNRYLLRVKMLDVGVENFNELGRRMGLSEGNLANVRALVAGLSWRPGLARRIERFLGVREGEIFRKEER